MKKWLVALLLLAMTLSLYACGGDTPANTATDEPVSASIDGDTAETGGMIAATDEPQDTDLDADTAEAGGTIMTVDLGEDTASESDTAETAGSVEDLNKTEFIVYEDRIFFIAKTSPELEAAIADTVNELFRAYPDELNKYLMIVPTRIAFEVPEVQALSADQKAEIKNVYMAVDSSVTLVDAYYALDQYSGDLNDIFYRTDHHWTQLGAYYAAAVFFEAAGIDYHKLDEYETHDGGEFLGYLQDLANDPYFYDKPDSITYYLLPGVNHKEWLYYKDVKTGQLVQSESTEVDDNRPAYEKFIGVNGFSHAIIFGNEEKDRSLLIIGYSYSNAFSIWCADNFNTVVFIDPRYYEEGKEGINELMDTYGVTDMMLLVSTSDSAAVVDNFASYVKRLTQ